MNIDEALETLREALPQCQGMKELGCSHAALDTLGEELSRRELTYDGKTAQEWAIENEKLEAQLQRQEAALQRLRDIADHLDPRPRKVMTGIIDDSLSTPPNQEAKTPFQQVTDELTRGCGCACHTGTGYHTACEHCRPTPPNQEPRRPPLFPGDRAMLRTLPAPPNPLAAHRVAITRHRLDWQRAGIDFEKLRKDSGWPTPNAMRRAADGFDTIGVVARYGDVLRWVADACDGILNTPPNQEDEE